LYDSINDNYGSVHFTDTDFHIEDADGHKMLVIEDGFMQIHKTDTIQSNLYTSGLTATRDHYLPDASGTIALTSDIPSLAGYVPTTRTISTTAPLSGGGDLSANRTLSIAKATTLVDGYLSATDWTTFNGKQSALVSGTNIKTINSTSLLGSGDVAVQPTLVSGTNIKTVNGTTILGSGDLTISTGITIGTTAITSGTVGRVLFEGTGNVVQESANLFWDNTNGRLGIGGTPSAFKLDIVGTSSANIIGVKVRNTSTNGYTEINCYNNTGGDNDRIYFGVGGTATGDVYQNRGYFISSLALEGITFTAGKATTGDMRFFTGGNNERLRIFGNGNIGINTTTDAGFKLDVNGTVRVGDNLILTNGIIATSTATTRLQGSLNYFTHKRSLSSGTHGYQISSYGTLASFWRFDGGSYDTEIGTTSTYNGHLKLFTNGVERFRITTGGNVLINTTTDVASSKLTIESTTQGFLPPRMTSAQRTAISSPAIGLQVYQTDATEGLYINKSTGWALLL
jgi:hypothetical protein